MKYKLGTVEASEQLIKDLYINLRNEVNAWSEVTFQTPQARMGYIGQHLVSVVTGYPGGKTGARGYDLVMDDGCYGEIKTCYRVDQLGQCKDCNAVVSSLETECSNCGSKNIIRKDDSKWLIGIQHETEFSEIVDPKRYYFVLFEFEELNNIDNQNIVASIWEVDPKHKGFGYCMIDYYLNIRENSKSKAPFNMWPYNFKFALTQPELIYRSFIRTDGTIETEIFPTMGNTVIDKLLPLGVYSSAKTIALGVIKDVIHVYAPNEKVEGKSKKNLLDRMEEIRQKQEISNNELCDSFADAVYLPLIKDKVSKVPDRLLKYFTALTESKNRDVF